MSEILLLGEFSGLHTNLKEGLEELGQSVLLVSSGDGEKNIKRDADISVEYSNFPGKIKKYYSNRQILKNLKGYDVVQFINPYIKPKSTLFSYVDIINNNKKIVCLACGDDIYVSDFVKNGGMHKYSPFDDEIKNNKSLPYDSLIHKIIQKKILNKMDLIIPTIYEYAAAYRKSDLKNKISKTIPFPINTKKIEYIQNKVNGKIIIYHASNRPITKGSSYIIEAMKIIKNKYPNDVEIICAEYLPLNEYLETINKAHIIIDQCRSYSYAMNALYSMAKGKIVLSGNEDECLKELGLNTSPVINITPNVFQIVQQLEHIIENKSEIEEMGIKSRKFVEKNHNHIEIAKKYLNAWNI
ncbi:glycosyltransferase [Paenisporosarcina sp. TG20]|uniref:glycosyltransferase n=1 Tax=Paenisporosarcina sp. TG20 TaxID=1211706 RepID=UPI00030F6A14|nr:glycosyltransferase [Paenisporosarcina sp. TG20]